MLLLSWIGSQVEDFATHYAFWEVTPNPDKLTSLFHTKNPCVCVYFNLFS
jgi:hypothetical protein